MCVRGLNGSGKATWLEAISELFRWFRRCASQGKVVAPQRESLLHEARLVAVELRDFFPGGPLWLAYGPEAEAFVRGVGAPAVTPGFADDGGALDWWSDVASRAELGSTAREDAPPNLLHLDAQRHYRSASVKDLREGRPTAAWLSVQRYDGIGPSALDRLLRELPLVRPTGGSS